MGVQHGRLHLLEGLGPLKIRTTLWAARGGRQRPGDRFGAGGGGHGHGSGGRHGSPGPAIGRTDDKLSSGRVRARVVGLDGSGDDRIETVHPIFLDVFPFGNQVDSCQVRENWMETTVAVGRAWFLFETGAGACCFRRLGIYICVC